MCWCDDSYVVCKLKDDYGYAWQRDNIMLHTLEQRLHDVGGNNKQEW
jgi:hypothetical protein